MTARPFRFPQPLYPILDPSWTKGDFLDFAERVLRAGTALVQLRVKGASTREFLELARELRRRTRERGVLLVVNDRVDVALAAGADGVHLGQRDLPPEEARRLLGPSAVVGWSTHCVEEIERANHRSHLLDYVSFGPVFPTSTKSDAEAPKGLEALREACRKSRLPVVAVGGISLDRIPCVLEAGARAAAVISALSLHPAPEEALSRVLGGPVLATRPSTREG
ncbi:MAG: thiamine-phosphate synthase [Candidatus Binatia bacterium]|nr:MAG: thiamine-phosphate synthase [Candidatus Binatia bacterium]